MSTYQNSVLVAKDIETNSNRFNPKEVGVKKKKRKENLLAQKIETFGASVGLIEPG